MKLKNCKNCGNEFEVSGTTSTFCSVKCRKHYNDIHKEGHIEGNQKICKICGEETFNLVNHVSKHDMTIRDYCDRFNLTVDQCRSWREKDKHYCKTCGKLFYSVRRKTDYCSEDCRIVGTSSNDIDYTLDDLLECRECGVKGFMLVRHINDKHDGVDAYLKKHNLSMTDIISPKYTAYFSNKFSGENNPGYQHGGRLSPFSKNFKKYKDLSLEERDEKLSEIYKRSTETMMNNGGTWNSYTYWMKKENLSEIEAKEKVSNLQATFSLDKCIKTYGKEQGVKIWKTRQDTWQQTLNSKSDDEKQRINSLKRHCLSTYINKYGEDEGKVRYEEYKQNVRNGYSNIAARLFSMIESHDDINEHWLYFYDSCSNDYEYILDHNDEAFSFDFYDAKSNRAIEFYGDFWHGSPHKYKPNDLIGIGKKEMTAQEKWDKDAERIKKINKGGVEVLVVWEHDFKNDEEKTLNKCIDFLLS